MTFMREMSFTHESYGSKQGFALPRLPSRQFRALQRLTVDLRSGRTFRIE
jgi:hypothetical protein